MRRRNAGWYVWFVLMIVFAILNVVLAFTPPYGWVNLLNMSAAGFMAAQLYRYRKGW